MQHTFYFCLSIFAKKKHSFHSLLLFLPIFYSEREKNQCSKREAGLEQTVLTRKPVS